MADIDSVLNILRGYCAESGAGLVFVSSAEGESDGVVRERFLSVPLRPCAPVRRCFLIFLSFERTVLSVESEVPEFILAELSVPTPVEVEAAPLLGTALDELSLFELSSGCACGVFALVSADGVALVAGLLLGSVVLVVAVFDELPGRALLFWSAGSVAVPLFSVVWFFGSVSGSARADAEMAKASAAAAMIFVN